MNYHGSSSKLKTMTSSEAKGQNARFAKRLIPDLRAGERVVLLQRQHPAVLFGGLLKPLLLLVLWVLSLIFVLPFIAGLQPDALMPPGQGLPSWLPAVLWLGWLGLAALLVLWGAYQVLDWNDDWIAPTNRRLIVMDKTPFLREARREAPVAQVQNVTAEYPNSMAVALDFGDLKVDMAGIGVLVFGNLPRPRRMREAIFNAQAEANAGQPSPEDLRRARARSIILGTDPAMHDRPTPPHGMPAVRGEGLGVRGDSRIAPTGQALIPNPSPLTPIQVLFPFTPWRDEESVTWHKHWLYLLRGVFWPLLLSALLIAAWFASITLGEQGQY